MIPGRYELKVGTSHAGRHRDDRLIAKTTWNDRVELFIENGHEDDPDSRWAAVELSYVAARELRDWLDANVPPRLTP